ncbi:KLH33 protein, partial [Polypterus senegalus]|nr:KLH33 protein [Polypterus senegalus]
MSASLQNETEDKRRPVDRRHEAYDFSFFQEMVAYRDAGILTDFTITLNSQHFNVHAVVLAAVSSVVLDLVLQGCQCLALDGKLNKLGVNEILRFAYCEKVELSEQNLDEIRKAASALGVSQLLELCHDLMRIGVSGLGFKSRYKSREAAVELGVASSSLLESDMVVHAWRYDPYQNSWQQLADMNQPRNYCSTVILNGLIYVLGGDIDTDHNLDTVECYNPTTNTWRFSHPLDQAQSGHASVVWNDKIYTSGGFNCKYKCLVCMFQYDPEKGTTYLADMQKDRAEHVMELLGDKMYVAGGVCNLREFYTDQFTCEVFSPQTNAWSLFTELLKPHVNAASGVLEQKLYIMGGYCQEDYSESCLAHRYDPRLDKWESVGRLPGPSNDIRACVISVPRHLRQ